MKRKLGKIRYMLLAVAATVFMTGTMTVQADEGYTYNYDYWGDVQYSPDAYSVAGVYTVVELGLDKPFSAPQGLFVSGDMVYICDTGNNRIVELHRTGNSFEVSRIIEQIEGMQGGADTLAKPTDIAVSQDGYLFIADQDNHRILKTDSDFQYVMEFTKPVDATFDQSLDFLPDKLTIDTAGRVYCIATNVNSGLIKYEADGNFAGFVGATKVTYDWTDYIWKRISTQAQRAQLESFVPTEYDNLYMDHEGFIYVCTTTVSESELRAGEADPIRRLNMMGDDILVRNGTWDIIGDLYWGEGGGYAGPSLITDVTVLDNDVFVGLDRVRGRLFAYDDQGRMLYAFGGNGNQDGYFRQPVAVEHMGHDILVLDAQDCSITLFTPTEFGSLIFEAIEQFQSGFYNESGETWEQVLSLNGNYDLAYIGIGRSLLRQERYREALEYFELKWDDENYSKAFKQYRKEWVEEHIVVIVLFVLLLACVPLAVGKLRRIKREIDGADIFKESEGKT